MFDAGLSFPSLVAFFAYLITMLRFALYTVRRRTMAFALPYSMLVGLIFFLILAFSDPFQGATGVDPTALEYVLERLQG